MLLHKFQYFTACNFLVLFSYLSAELVAALCVVSICFVYFTSVCYGRNTISFPCSLGSMLLVLEVADIINVLWIFIVKQSLSLRVCTR